MTTPSDSEPFVTAHVRLRGEDWQLEADVTVPRGPVSLRQALPMVQALADRVVAAGVETAEAKGEHISCTKGCGACCRQLVPIAEVEARNIHDVVEALPEPRRSEVKARFAVARQRLSESGVLIQLEQRGQWAEGSSREIGIAYFQLGIACPFLEEESCSIYADRPVACREYLVTSPVAECARPTPEAIRMVKMPMKVWSALARFDPVPPGARAIRWVPLVLAPEWADTHPDEAKEQPGPEMLRQLFDYLTKNRGPEPGGP